MRSRRGTEDVLEPSRHPREDTPRAGHGLAACGWKLVRTTVAVGGVRGVAPPSGERGSVRRHEAGLVRLDGLAGAGRRPEAEAALPSMPAVAGRPIGLVSRCAASLAMAAVALIACAAVCPIRRCACSSTADLVTGTAQSACSRLEDGSLALLDARSAVAVNLHRRPARGRAAGRQRLLRGRAVYRAAVRRARRRRRGDGGRHRLRRADRIARRSRCRSSPASCALRARQARR